MTLEKAKQELEKFVQLKTTLRPSFVDVLLNAEEVVRCRDCRYYHVYWESNGHIEKGYGACDWINDNSVREDHFCSWGERKDD